MRSSVFILRSILLVLVLLSVLLFTASHRVPVPNRNVDQPRTDDQPVAEFLAPLLPTSPTLQRLPSAPSILGFLSAPPASDVVLCILFLTDTHDTHRSFPYHRSSGLYATR